MYSNRPIYEDHTKDKFMLHVKRTNPRGTLHVATCTYVESQVSLKRGLYVMCEGPVVWGTQHAHRVVVKKNTSTEDTCNNTEEEHREYRKLGE